MQVQMKNTNQIDIDCQLMSLTHSQVLETTKQQIIMNIDNPLSEADLNNRLKKLNKLTNTLVPGLIQNNKTLLTKGLTDTYRLVIEAAVLRSTQKIPLVLAFDQCTNSLLAVLNNYAQKNIIQLQIGSLNTLKTLQAILQGLTSPSLVCFPMVDQVTGQLLLTEEILQFVAADTFVGNWYLDLSGGAPIINEILTSSKTNLRDSMPFHFWSIDCNQINGTNKTGLLMFKSNRFKQLDSPDLLQPKSLDNHAVMADSLLGAFNSLQVFLCNRQLKNNRISLLQAQLFNLLSKAQLLLRIDLEHLHKSYKSQTLGQIIMSKGRKQKNPLVVVNVTSKSQSPNITLITLLHQKGSSLKQVPLELINKTFKDFQIQTVQMAVTRLHFLRDFADKSLFSSTFQVSTNDLTFSFVIKNSKPPLSVNIYSGSAYSSFNNIVTLVYSS